MAVTILISEGRVEYAEVFLVGVLIVCLKSSFFYGSTRLDFGRRVELKREVKCCDDSGSCFEAGLLFRFWLSWAAVVFVFSVRFDSKVVQFRQSSFIMNNTNNTTNNTISATPVSEAHVYAAPYIPVSIPTLDDLCDQAENINYEMKKQADADMMQKLQTMLSGANGKNVQAWIDQIKDLELKDKMQKMLAERKAAEAKKAEMAKAKVAARFVNRNTCVGKIHGKDCVRAGKKKYKYLCKQCYASQNRKDYKGLTPDQRYEKKKEKEQERKRQREDQAEKNKAELKVAQEKQAEKKRLKKAMFGGSQQSAPAVSSVQPRSAPAQPISAPASATLPLYAQHVVDAHASHTVPYVNCAVCFEFVAKTVQNSCNACGAHAHEKCREAHSAMHAREEQQAAQMQNQQQQNQMNAGDAGESEQLEDHFNVLEQDSEELLKEADRLVRDEMEESEDDDGGSVSCCVCNESASDANSAPCLRCDKRVHFVCFKNHEHESI